MKINVRLLFAAFTSILFSVTPFQTVLAAEVDFDFFESNTVRMYDPNAAGACSPVDGGSSTVGSVTIDSDFSLGEDRSLRPVKLLEVLAKDFNLAPFEAAGIVGNFMLESGGNHVPPDVNEGGAVGPPAFRGGYGWAQWTGPRQVTFIDYAVDNGFMKDRSVNATDAANYAYLAYELTETSESAVIPAIRNAKDVDDATRIWEDVFERAGIVNLAERQSRARTALAAYENGRGIDTTTGEVSVGQPGVNNCPIGNSPVSSAEFGNVTFPLEGNKSVVNNPGIFRNNTTDVAQHDYTAYDIYADAGTKVVAFTSGVVLRHSNDICGSRIVIVVHEETNIAVSYMHITSQGLPPVGSTIQPGDQIGFIASVDDFPCVNVDHLHIDAMEGGNRLGCATGNCSDERKSMFVDIGPDLYRTYQELGG